MKRYSSYKDSGVEWIGEIPKSWSVKRLSYLLKPISVKNNPNERNLSVYRDYGVIPTDSRDDNHNKISEDTSTYKLVEVGDFVMNKMKCWMGSLGVSEYRGIVSPSYTVLKPIENFHGKYIHYLLRSPYYIPQYKRLSYGVRPDQWDLRYEDFRELVGILPPLTEQQQIVSYLDEQTSSIDTLIQSKQKKITLLKEKRTSLINQIVTKGLNPNVEMKDSGVEWIGEIPRGWDIPKLWYIVVENILGGNYSSSPQYNGLPLIKMGNMDRGKIKLDSIEYIESSDTHSEEHILKYNDFLFNTRNSEKLVGKVCLWKGELDESLYNSNVMKIQFDGSVLNEFMNYLFNTESVIQHLKLISKGTTSVSGIYYKDLSEMSIIRPPFSEQQQIVQYLDKETELIDKTISIEERKIELLKEYKQSLISEVITGKRKVVSDE